MFDSDRLQWLFASIKTILKVSLLKHIDLRWHNLLDLEDSEPESLNAHSNATWLKLRYTRDTHCIYTTYTHRQTQLKLQILFVSTATSYYLTTTSPLSLFYSLFLPIDRAFITATIHSIRSSPLSR